MAGEKILIVDSNAELIENIGEHILTPHGFKPLLAYSQSEGVKLAVTKSPQLLLLHLPVELVTQMLQRIAQTGRLIPTILMIEQESLVIPIELLRLGVVDYVVQPFTAEDILQTVRRVLAREARSINYQELTENLTEFNQAFEQRTKEFGFVLGTGNSNVPLKADDKVIGVLGVDNQIAASCFSLMDLRRLTELADMAATAGINAHQYSEARREIGRHIAEAATLQAIAGQLSMVTDFNMGAQLALSLALKATNAEAGVLAWVTEGQQNSLRYVLQGYLNSVDSKEQTGKPTTNWWNEQTLQEVIRSGQPEISYGAHHSNGGSNGKKQDHIRSRLTVPMRRGNKVMGAINLESTPPNAFAQEDLQFVTSVADQVVIALESALLQERAESEQERLALIMEAVDNGVWLVDADLRLMAQNEAASQMLGWSEAEVVGRAVCDFEPENGGSVLGICQLLGQVIENRQRVSHNDNVFLAKKNGPSVPVKVRIVPVIREEKVRGAVCAFDLSKNGDEHVRFEFANMASHLLRTPLTSIQTTVDVLIDAELDLEEQRTMLDRLREQSQRMCEFVKELVEMSRLEAGIVRVYAEPVALSPLLDRVLGLIRYEEPDYTFNLTIVDTLPIVAADLAKTELILVNLLRNGVSHCSNSGHINLEIGTEGDEVIISIADDGEAIPVTRLNRIFSQFYPTESTHGAVTSTYHLGLYSTKRLIELQNGRVWVESQPGKGSRFSFSLPIWREHAHKDSIDRR